MFSVDVEAIDLAPILEQFARDGYARLGRVVADETLAALGARVDDIMAARVRHEGLFFQRDSDSGRYEDLKYGAGWQGPSPEYRKIEKLEIDPLFRAYIGNRLHERIARALIDGPISLYRAVLFTKSATGGTLLPWHQDGGLFWGIDRMPFLQLWTALDDCPLDGGCLEVLPGTQRAGLTTIQGGVVPDDRLAAVDAEKHALPLPAKAGEMMLIHNHVWHRSLQSHSGRRRSTLSVCLMTAETRCLRKKRAPRDFYRVFP